MPVGGRDDLFLFLKPSSTTSPCQQCPPPLAQYWAGGKRVCGLGLDYYCDPAVFPVHGKDHLVTMTATFGLVLLAIMRNNLIPIQLSLCKLNTLDAHHHLMWVVTIIVTLPQLLEAPDSGTPTTPSGMGRTATLGATAEIICDYHGFGGHSNMRPATTLQFAGVPLIRDIVLPFVANCLKFMLTNY